MGDSNFQTENMKLFSVLATSTLAASSEFDEIVNQVNSNPDATWVAGHNFHADYKLDDVKRLCGAWDNAAYDTDRTIPERFTKSEAKDIPATFDSRTQWPNCTVIGEIRDQGACGSCWAFGAAEMFSDRVCIASSGAVNKMYSAEDMTACCTHCGDGCNGGYPLAAMDFLSTHGLPTGGLYGDTTTCKPYTLKPCEHHVPGDRPPCTGDGPTPKCEKKCIPEYTTKTYIADKAFGQRGYAVHSKPSAIQTEIMTYGPVEAAFQVYSDFPTYKSGVYKHTSGSLLGGHAIKIIGWGSEDNMDYWLVNNSWNSDWGDHGTFKILRGSNECGIEGGVVGVHVKAEQLL